jgi:heptosyltransferase-2
MKRILFIKLGAIGDVIQAAAAVEVFKANNEGLKIDWVVGQSISKLLAKMGIADKVIILSDQELFSGSLLDRLKSLLACWIELIRHGRSYDVIYVAHTNWQYSLLALPAYILNPLLSLHKQKRFFPRLKEYRVSEYLRFLSGRAISHIEGAEVLQRLGDRILSNTNKERYFSDNEWSKPPVTQDNFGSQLESLRKRVVLVPGGSKNALRDDFLRRWPVDDYVQLSKVLLDKGCQVILAGGPGDSWVSPYFSSVNVTNLIGKTSLEQLVGVLAEADLVITHDTGPLHLATLTRTPLIALFGPTPAPAVAPIGRKELITLIPAANVSCAPCYDGKDYAACSDPICMKSIAVDEVFSRAKFLLDSEG